jgi:hypothetical protein
MAPFGVSKVGRVALSHVPERTSSSRSGAFLNSLSTRFGAWALRARASSPWRSNPLRSLCEECLVADHGRRAHVCVVGQLGEHKGSNIRTRYSLCCVRTPEENSVFALGGFVG